MKNLKKNDLRTMKTSFVTDYLEEQIEKRDDLKVVKCAEEQFDELCKKYGKKLRY